jgi:hypothetical protein
VPVALITEEVLYQAKVTEHIDPLLVIVLCLIIIVPEILGFVFGFEALNTIKASQGRLSGKPLAITGIVLCSMWFVILLIIFLGMLFRLS